MSGFHPTTELVAVAWLKGITALGGAVATELPADTSSWASTGFVQVQGVGGTPALDLPVARPVVSVDFWWVAPSSSKPPWNKANQLAEHLRAHLSSAWAARVVTLPAGYASARVTGAWLLTEPRRIRDDAADYAHFQADLQLNWVEVP